MQYVSASRGEAPLVIDWRTPTNSERWTHRGHEGRSRALDGDLSDYSNVNHRETRVVHR